MNIEKQLETAVKTNHLVLVVFYADWSPHYEWIGPVLRTYEKRTVELIRVNAEENRTIADAHNVETVPAFLLLHKGHELWRQVGELTVEELKEVLDDFQYIVCNLLLAYMKMTFSFSDEKMGVLNVLIFSLL